MAYTEKNTGCPFHFSMEEDSLFFYNEFMTESEFR